MELLSESAGEHFGIEMDGGPPSRVRSNLTDGTLVVDFFVNLFEVLGMEEEVRAVLGDRACGFSARRGELAGRDRFQGAWRSAMIGMSRSIPSGRTLPRSSK